MIVGLGPGILPAIHARATSHGPDPCRKLGSATVLYVRLAGACVQYPTLQTIERDSEVYSSGKVDSDGVGH